MEVVELAQLPTHHINYNNQFEADIIIWPPDLQAANVGSHDAKRRICTTAFGALKQEYGDKFTSEHDNVVWDDLKIKVIRTRKEPVVTVTHGRHEL